MATLYLGGGKQEYRLGQLAAVESVFAIADGAHGEYHVGFGPTVGYQGDGLLKALDRIVDRHLALLKELLRPLLTIVDHLARGAEYIDVVGAEGNHDGIDPIVGRQLDGESGDGVAHADGVVHHAVGVDRHAEAVVGKESAHIVGKAAAQKEHARAGLYLEVSTRKVDWCL